MLDWLKSLPFTFADILTLLAMGGSIVAAIISWLKSLASKKSEKLSAEYAKNADDTNTSAKKYYDEMVVLVNQQIKVALFEKKIEVYNLLIKLLRLKYYLRTKNIDMIRSGIITDILGIQAEDYGDAHSQLVIAAVQEANSIQFTIEKGEFIFPVDLHNAIIQITKEIRGAMEKVILENILPPEILLQTIEIFEEKNLPQIVEYLKL